MLAHRVVRKADGTWRFCVDLWLVNHITKKQHWPLRELEEMLAHLVGSSLDLIKGFWQFPLSEPSCTYVAFATMLDNNTCLLVYVVMGAQNSSSHSKRHAQQGTLRTGLRCVACLSG